MGARRCWSSACAVASIRAMPWRSAIWRRVGRSRGWPKRWTAMIPRGCPRRPRPRGCRCAGGPPAGLGPGIACTAPFPPPPLRCQPTCYNHGGGGAGWPRRRSLSPSGPTTCSAPWASAAMATPRSLPPTWPPSWRAWMPPRTPRSRWWTGRTASAPPSPRTSRRTAWRSGWSPATPGSWPPWAWSPGRFRPGGICAPGSGQPSSPETWRASAPPVPGSPSGTARRGWAAYALGGPGTFSAP